MTSLSSLSLSSTSSLGSQLPPSRRCALGVDLVDLDRAAKVAPTFRSPHIDRPEYLFSRHLLQAFDVPLNLRNFGIVQKALVRHKLIAPYQETYGLLSFKRACELTNDVEAFHEQLNGALFDMRVAGLPLTEDEQQKVNTAVRAFVQQAYEDFDMRLRTSGDHRQRLLRLMPSERHALEHGASAMFNEESLNRHQFERPRLGSGAKQFTVGLLTLGCGLPIAEAVAAPEPTSMGKHIFFPHAVRTRNDSALLVQCLKKVGYLSHGRRRRLSNPAVLDAAFPLAADHGLRLDAQQQEVIRGVCQWFENQQPRARAQEQQRRNFITRLFT